MASQKADIIHSPLVVVRRSSRPVGVHVLSPTDVPLLVQSFFDHERAVYGDGQTTPLVTIYIFQALVNEKTTPSIFTTTGPRALVSGRLWLQSPTSQQNLLIPVLVCSGLESPTAYQFGQHLDPYLVTIRSSSRYLYGNEFGMGKQLATRCRWVDKYDGRVVLYPGRRGGGSINLEACLSPEAMKALECAN
ncbi:hypothetical protein ACFX1T_043125 [Malus domestica]